MEAIQGVTQYKMIALNHLFARFAFILLCLRGYFAGIISDTLVITLFLNVIIALAIDYKSVRSSFFIFATLSLLTVYNREVLALIDILAIIYVLRGSPISFLIKANALCLVFFLIIWLLMLSLGILKDNLMIMPKGIAHCMGYDNPNLFGKISFYIIASLYLIVSKKIRIIVLLFIPLINEFFFSLSIARTSWAGCYVFLLIAILSYCKIIRPIFKYLIAILPVFILILLIYFSKNIAQYPILDVIFTTRFSLSKFSLINWIIGFKKTSDIILDSSYLSILCSGGIACIVYFWWNFYNAIVKKWNVLYEYLPFIIAMLAMGIGENVFSSANALSLIFWFLIFDYKTPKHKLV